MKKAFSLIELIFVIVIIGIMAGIGFSSFQPKYLIDDVNFIQVKIKEAQFLGIGYEHNGFGIEESNPDFKNGCISLTKSGLDENVSKKNEVNYKLHVSITAENGVDTTLCFDAKGRPHEGDFTKASLYKEQKTFTFKYSSKSRKIIIEPYTGYVIIED